MFPMALSITELLMDKQQVTARFVEYHPQAELRPVQGLVHGTTSTLIDLDSVGWEQNNELINLNSLDWEQHDDLVNSDSRDGWSGCYDC